MPSRKRTAEPDAGRSSAGAEAVSILWLAAVLVTYLVVQLPGRLVALLFR